jgi:hypothetical protein
MIRRISSGVYGRGRCCGFGGRWISSMGFLSQSALRGFRECAFYVACAYVATLTDYRN